MGALPALALFALSAAAIWYAGIRLSLSTDVISERLGWGEALGGLVLLGIVTTLPEIAITASAALHHDLGLAIGNILGGISIQTVVLVILDVFGLGSLAALSYRAASLTLVVEGLLVVAVLVVTLIGTQMPRDLIFLRMTPPTLFIALLWLGGLWLVKQARTELPWHDSGAAPGGQRLKRGGAIQARVKMVREKRHSFSWVVMVFAIAALVTLAAGVALEVASEVLAKQLHMDGVVFGATLLAAATALPEVSTGLAAMKLGDYQLAVSDIFGGNAFLPVLFLVATLLSGKAVLPHAAVTDIYLTALAMLLTLVYAAGLLFRPQRRIARMGVDSLLVLILYALGVVGLFTISAAG
ncbi:MAG TPA: sodium:calcium antiporter [Gammaproteobacteria bacterium]|nr:sodium:calcium antiporter [Gammaproteobacteria bacterium]